MADAPQDTLDGTVTSIVFRNDETGYSVLRVSDGGGNGEFLLYVHGRAVRKVPPSEAVAAVLAILP